MSMLQKLKKLGISAMVLAAGFAYYLAARFFFAVPCMFRTLTEFKCPGCGITHMLVAELQLDFAQAYAANPALYLLQPVIGYFIGKMYVCWFFDKRCVWSRTENTLLYVVVTILVVFGIDRNV